MKSPSRLLITTGAVALLLMLAFAGCSSSDEPASAPADSGDEVTTEAPAETAPADEDDDGSDSGDEPGEDSPVEPPADDDTASEPELEPGTVPVWTWVLGALLLLAAVVWMAGRNGAASDD